MLHNKNGELSFSEACAYLSVSPADFTALREQRLVACTSTKRNQTYPQDRLDLTRCLLNLGKERNWNTMTLAWYADLLFAAEIGRAILLPVQDYATSPSSSPTSWLETPYAVAVLENLKDNSELRDVSITPLLRSLAAVAVGNEQFWPDLDTFEQSALYPIVIGLEKTGVPIIGQDTTIARDALNNYALMVLGFGRIAPPISAEFAALVEFAQHKLSNTDPFQANTPSDERELILKQSLIPVDKIYASKATEIHTPPLPEAWNFHLGVLRAERRTIAVQMRLPIEADQPLIDNILDMIRPFLGTFGARVVQLLYEIANDPPHYRHPIINVDTNEMLDRLGLKRDDRGVHRSKNRERLRDALNAAHALEIVAEYTAQEKGKLVRKQLYRTVLSILGATFDAEENASFSTLELRERGLPKSLQIRLNFYDGIRQPDGRLGNQFVLVPRLAAPKDLQKANYAATAELLRAYLLFRYRQTKMKNRTLVVTRQTALEKANITTKNVTRATEILTRALNKLVADGTVEHFGELPIKSDASFEVTLSERVVFAYEKDG